MPAVAGADSGAKGHGRRALLVPPNKLAWLGHRVAVPVPRERMEAEMDEEEEAGLELEVLPMVLSCFGRVR